MKARYYYYFDGDGGTPAISVSPSTWNYGNTPVGTPVSKVFTILNSGTAALEITLPITSSDSAFTITAQPGSTVLAPGASTTFTAQADADVDDWEGVFNANISITNNSSENPKLVAITATITAYDVANLLFDFFAGNGLAQPASVSSAGDAQPVSSWQGAIGLVPDNTLTARPTYRLAASMMNNRGAVEFLGSSSQYLDTNTANGILDLPVFTLAIVLATASSPSNAWLYSEGNSASNNPQVSAYLIAGNNPSSAVRDDAGAGTNIALTRIVNNSLPHLIIVKRDATGYTIEVDGQISALNATVLGAQTFNRLTLGALQRTTIGNYFTGQMGLVRAWSTDVSDGIRAIIMDYYSIADYFVNSNLSHPSTID